MVGEHVPWSTELQTQWFHFPVEATKGLPPQIKAERKSGPVKTTILGGSQLSCFLTLFVVFCFFVGLVFGFSYSTHQRFGSLSDQKMDSLLGQLA